MKIHHALSRALPRILVVAVIGCTISCAAAPDAPRESEAEAASTYIYPPLGNGDHWGCDTDNQPPLDLVINSLGDHGACCDSHDACMDNVPGCFGDAGHWLTAFNCRMGFQTAGCNDACIQCHLGVMACLTGPSTGISNCVGFQNCGDARRDGNPFGCTNDQICQATGGQFSRCNNTNGNCEIQGLCPAPGCYNAFEGQCHQPDGCGPGRVLDAGSCTCIVGQTCTACLGQSCGPDRSCNSGLTCGSCDAGWTCNPFGNCEQVTTCTAFCGNGICECSEPSYCGEDCGGGGGGGGDDCPQDCFEVCGGTGLCSNGICLCGT